MASSRVDKGNSSVGSSALSGIVDDTTLFSKLVKTASLFLIASKTTQVTKTGDDPNKLKSKKRQSIRFSTNVVQYTYTSDSIKEGEDRTEDKRSIHLSEPGYIGYRQERFLSEAARVEKWSGKLEFFLSCVGYTVGLGNVWRFPFVVHKYGGGLFLIPYITMVLVFAVPVFFIELSLGQFTSRGPYGCWDFAKLFKGIGVAMIMISTITSIYYNIIIAWVVYYMYASLANELPWSKCQEQWNTSTCLDFKRDCADGQLINNTDGSCRDINGNHTDEIRSYISKSLARGSTLAAEDYFHYILDYKTYATSAAFDMNWAIALCSLLVWIVIVSCLINGIKSAGKVVYVTATMPYVIIIGLLIHALTLEGSWEGVVYYFVPDQSRGSLMDPNMWLDAGAQLFFSLSVTDGGLINLASYNRFHHDVFRDTLLVAMINCLTSVLSGFMLFAYLGHLSFAVGLTIDNVVKQGPAFTFIIIPAALTNINYAPVVSFLFFLMLFQLGLDTQFVLVMNVILLFRDAIPSANRHILLTGVVMLCGLPGLFFCTPYGLDLVEIVDKYVADWNSMFISLCYLIALAWIYGADNYLDCVECMIGRHHYFGIPWKFWRGYWKLNWKFISPAIIILIMITEWLNFERLTTLGVAEDFVHVLITGFSVVAIGGHMIYFISQEEGTLKKRIQTLINPLPSWGPLFQTHRREWVMCYKPDFDVDLKYEKKVKRSMIKDGMFDTHGVSSRANVVSK